MGAPVYATHNAYVVSYHGGVNAIPPDTFINNSYGNYVLLVGQLPNGSKFFTIYGHLLDVSPEVVAASGQPTLIHKGDIIGYEDATGSTWDASGTPGGGTHLHYQSQGLGDLVLPPGCPQ